VCIGASAVCVQGLSYSYGTSEPVLHDVDFAVPAGETAVLTGASGCGKTTLCHCLTGLAPKSLGGTLTGSVRILGDDIEPLGVPAICTRIGMVFQDPDNQLVTTTVEDELAFGPENLAVEPAEIRRRVDRELARFGLERLALRAPGELSGGEKRLVATAAVLTLDPPVVILDEPFSHLDERGRRRVREAVLELQASGRTLLIVEHDLALVDFAHRFLVLEEGRLIADTASPPVLSAYGAPTSGEVSA
jgi:energy-coupling factor transport system ATP-binding protein